MSDAVSPFDLLRERAPLPFLVAADAEALVADKIVGSEGPTTARLLIVGTLLRPRIKG